MHINMKYYIVTIGAIFISLGIGMLVGFNLNYDQELSKQQTEIINDLDEKFENLKNANNDLEGKLKSLNLSYDKTIDFINDNVDKLIPEELSNQNIGIISTNGSTDINYAQEAIKKANGNVLFNINFTDKVTDENLLNKLSQQTKSEIKNTEELIIYVLEALKNDGAQEKLQPLQDLGLLDIRSINSDYMKATSIVLSGDGKTKDFKSEFENLDKILIEKLKSEEKYIIGVETTDTKSSYIGLYSENKIATVDNINQGSGQLALILSLKDGNVIGNFGIGDGAESLIPYK